MNSLYSPDAQNNLIVEKYTTVQTAAEVADYNVQYLRRLLRAGKLAGIKIGQVWLISLASLANYIQQAEEVVDRRCGPKAGRISHQKQPHAGTSISGGAQSSSAFSVH
jgi:excisionase family DNA binding protein